MKIIAELGTNTGGDLTRALAMVDAAAECGCDGVKVQAYETGDFLPEGHPDWDMFESNRLTWGQIEAIHDKTVGEYDLLFGATPTSLDGVERLARLNSIGVDFLKNGSDYLLRHDMIDAMVATGIETWVSTGMADEDEIIDVAPGVKFMACTSVYPCPDEEANVRRIVDDVLFANGYSDHTTGTVAAVMACTLGAEMFEKHFTLDRSLPGPDHHFSADPSEMAALVRDVRRAEKMMGSSEQRVAPSEAENRDKWRVTVEQPLRG